MRNPISFLGLGLATLSTAFGLPLMFMDMFSRRTHPYLGVVIYMVLPFIASAGVATALVGLLWERRRRKRHPGMKISPLPQIDLNQPKVQAAVALGLSVVVTIAVLLSITGYRAYHFTDSVQFCGLVCHQVMKPEYTAYQHSPHARVACVQCHVGPGANWFVRSKITGAYQVYAVAFNRFPRPIPTPIEDLRPAQETCEQCHWPAKFFGAQQKTFNHFLTDEFNSPWAIQMLIKIEGLQRLPHDPGARPSGGGGQGHPGGPAVSSSGGCRRRCHRIQVQPVPYRHRWPVRLWVESSWPAWQSSSGTCTS